jgi:hypothetical protein
MNIGDLVSIKKSNVFHELGLGIILELHAEPDRTYYDVFFPDSGETYGIFDRDLEKLSDQHER